MPGAQQMVDIGQRRLCQKPDTLRLDRQDILTPECLDRNIIARNLPVLRLIGAEGKRSSAIWTVSAGKKRSETV